MGEKEELRFAFLILVINVYRFPRLLSLLVEALVLAIMQCVVVRIVLISCTFGRMPEYL